jgi:UDP-N-acetylglucosamine:LPS N-acetylglucosamine transferase
MPNFRICLAFSDTGGGHRSAVEAIEAGINEIALHEPRGNQFDLVLDNVCEKSHPVNRAFVDAYNYILRHDQKAMKYYYWLIETLKPNDSEIGYRISAPYLKKLYTRVDPHVVVSVHPMANQYTERALQDAGLRDKVKFVCVVTDPNGNFWKGWACPQADLTIVPNELARDQLIAWGVPHDRIRTLGMPVHPDFVKPPTVSRDEFRSHLGLRPDRLTICINAGWAGGGNMSLIYKALSQVSRPIQAVFLCGHNRELYERARELAAHGTVPTAVLPFHDRMSDLMAAMDMMVTKAGGLTTFEAIARRLPIVFDTITKPMPQEAGTVEMLVKQGVAQAVQEPDDIVDIVENFTPAFDRTVIKLPNANQLDRAGAIFDICRAIMSYCDPLYQPIVEQHPNIEHMPKPKRDAKRA